MKKILLIFVALFAMVGLASCKKETKVDPNKTTGSSLKIDLSETFKRKVTLTVWMDDANGTYFQQIGDAFKKVEPNIHVIFQNVGAVDAREQLKTKGPSGNGADIFQFPHDHLAPAVLEDLALPLSDKLNKIAEERTLPTAYNTSRFTDPSGNKQTYAVVNSVEAIGLYYNADKVDKPAETFEQILRESSEAISKNPNAKYFVTTSGWNDPYFLQPILSSFGYTPFGKNLDDKNQIGFDSQDYKNALTFLRENSKNLGIAADSKGNGEEFTNGNASYVMAGPWNHEGFTKAGINYKRALFPTLNGKQMRPFSGAILSSIYKNTKHQTEAEKFLEFMLSEEAGRILFTTKDKLPALKGKYLENIDGIKGNEVLKNMSEQIDLSTPMPQIAELSYFWGPAATALTDLFAKPSESIDSIADAAYQGYRLTAKLS